MTQEFDEILNFDAFTVAEKATGKSYKDDEETKLLGLHLFIQAAQRKKEELALRGDTYMSMTFVDFVRVTNDLGFTEIFSEQFTNRFHPEETEERKVFWKNGILLTANSYHQSLNSAKVYYNWKPSSQPFPTQEEIEQGAGASHLFTSSGSWHGFASKHGSDTPWEKLVWSGDHDARDGLRNTLENLQSHGEFLGTWVHQPHLWFINNDKESDDYQKINQAVIAQFPEEIQQAIKGKTEA